MRPPKIPSALFATTPTRSFPPDKRPWSGLSLRQSTATTTSTSSNPVAATRALSLFPESRRTSSWGARRSRTLRSRRMRTVLRTRPPLSFSCRLRRGLLTQLRARRAATALARCGRATLRRACSTTRLASPPSRASGTLRVTSTRRKRATARCTGPASFFPRPSTSTRACSRSLLRRTFPDCRSRQRAAASTSAWRSSWRGRRTGRARL
eukprot:Amastigsp_a844677_142.p3 type:complete len:209 gc:universal Amastigsp_a844677_142:795-169(-)